VDVVKFSVNSIRKRTCEDLGKDAGHQVNYIEFYM
jgi:hypothetical protein